MLILGSLRRRREPGRVEGHGRIVIESRLGEAQTFRMKEPKIEVRCQACREWYYILRSNLGGECQCPNCLQVTRPVPRTSSQRTARTFAIILMVIGGIVLALWIRGCMVDSMARTRSGGGGEQVAPRW